MIHHEKGNAQNIQTPPMQMWASKQNIVKNGEVKFQERRFCNSEMDNEKRVEKGEGGNPVAWARVLGVEGLWPCVC